MLAKTKNKTVLKWVDECAKLTRPKKVVWLDGSEEEKKRLEEEALKTGELILLNQKKLPGCFLHRSARNDVARTEQLTFICSKRKEDAGPTNNWMALHEAYEKLFAIFDGSMKERIMYVIPFLMGPKNSPFSKVGVQLTDSIYVALNMRIMTRMGEFVWGELGEYGEFTRCLHGKADLDLNRRFICHFPEDNTIWSVGSGYGGNALLGKKCLSLRIASYTGLKEGWLAEHMLIMGVETPEGGTHYIAAAFPSACGKTNLAMLVPPETMRGYRVWTIGDDIAWMRPGKDGRLWAVNPETGFFGVAPGTSMKTNPNAMKTIQKNTIYTNVVLKKDGTVWWEGTDGEPPDEALDWNGEPWKPGMKDAEGKTIKGAHPNSRFTAPASQCPSISPHWEDPEGVPISAIVFGGRRSKLTPLVYQSYSWQHGVFVGATMASETTAAAMGALGVVRRDPMAMLPFCGYNMGDYFRHWLKIGEKLRNPPKIFNVNWFKTGDDGKFLWPGYGENLRVLDWMIRRCEGKADAVETEVGHIPTKNSLNLSGLNLSDEALSKLLSVDHDAWLEEVGAHDEFLKKFGDKLPQQIRQEHKALHERLYKGGKK